MSVQSLDTSAAIAPLLTPRAQRSAEMRAVILLRCRGLMKRGYFRPTIEQLAWGTVTRKAVRYHFETIGQLHDEAIADDETRVFVLKHLMPNGPWPSADDCARILRALSIGRLTQ